VAELAAVYARLVGSRVRSQMEYRASLAFQIVGTAAIGVVDFVAIVVLFSNVDALAGWSLEEVALLYGFAAVSFFLTDLAIGHLDLFPQMIRDGTFDLVLVRPLPSLLQVIASDFSLRRVGKAVQGLAVLGWALTQAEIAWDPLRVAYVPVIVLAGALVYAGIWVTMATIAFWIVDAMEFVNAFTYGGNYLASYPLDVFARWLRSFVVFVVPVGFVAYFPASALLDRGGWAEALGWLAPAVGAALCGVSCLVWTGAVRHYRSAGG
jgi:ABC-2 type transport system permease protein